MQWMVNFMIKSNCKNTKVNDHRKFHVVPRVKHVHVTTWQTYKNELNCLGSRASDSLIGRSDLVMGQVYRALTYEKGLANQR